MISLLDYLSRIGKSKGFGIQSPWAYSFVKDVITEKLPYYKYDEIDKQYKDKKTRKRQKLYFRVSNYLHNKNLLIIKLSSHSLNDIIPICNELGSEGVIILEDIYASEESKAKWFELRDSNYIGITFDLYFCAICFMPNGMYKQHYKLNF